MNVKFWFRQSLSATGVTSKMFDDLNKKVYNSTVVFPCMPKVNMVVNILSFIDDFELNNEEKETLQNLVQDYRLFIYQVVIHKDFIVVEIYP